jgi:hypothetical protein
MIETFAFILIAAKTGAFESFARAPSVPITVYYALLMLPSRIKRAA